MLFSFSSYSIPFESVAIIWNVLLAYRTHTLTTLYRINFIPIFFSSGWKWTWERKKKISFIDKLYDIQRWTPSIVWFRSKHLTDFLLFDEGPWRTTKNHHENRQYCLVSLTHFLNPLDWNYTKEYTSLYERQPTKKCDEQNNINERSKNNEQKKPTTTRTKHPTILKGNTHW